jgi:hypothetical protein
MARLLSLFLLLAPAIVGIKVTPRMVMANGYVRIMCLVPHRPTNRQLVIELPGYVRSERQLDGENSPQVFEVGFEHVPCIVEQATCSVVDDLGKVATASAELVRAGCSE